MINKLKREVRIVGGVAKIVETKEGKIINIIKDLKKHKPLKDDAYIKTKNIEISKEFIEPSTTFTQTANRFYDNLKEFISENGDEYYKSFGNRIEINKSTSKKLRKLICDYIIDRFYVIYKIENIKIPTFYYENYMSKWFEENCHLFGFKILDRHKNGIDYLCKYEFNDPVVTSIILKDKKIRDFFSTFIILNDNIFRNTYLQVELELDTQGFIDHKHSIDETDMVICCCKNRDLEVPILQLYLFIDYSLEYLENYIITIECLLSNTLMYGDRNDLIEFGDHFLRYIKITIELCKDGREKEKIIEFLSRNYKTRIVLETLVIEKIITKEHMENIMWHGIIDHFYIDNIQIYQKMVLA